MPLNSLDIWFCYTGGATGPSNNTLSLGGTLTSPITTIPSGVANNIFDDVTGDESETGDTEYRGIGIYINTINSGGSFDAIRPRIWISGYVRSGGSRPDTIFIGASTFGLNRNTMGVCANEGSAPNEGDANIKWIREDVAATIYFGSDNLPTTIPPATEGTLKSQNWVGLWLKRVVPSTADAFSNRSCTIVFRCETTASPYLHPVERYYVIKF